MADAQAALIIAIDVAQLRELYGFTAQAQKLIFHVKSADPEVGCWPIRVPGKAAGLANKEPHEQPICVSARTLTQLGPIATELMLAMPEELRVT